MQGIMRFSGVLLLGGIIGYGLAQLQQSVSAAPESVTTAPAMARPDDTNATAAAPAATMPALPATEQTQQPVIAAVGLSAPAWQQSTVDETWLAFVEQQYPKRLQQDLSAFPDGVKQEMQAFQQTVVDADWAQATEQQLQDILITQQELKFVQVERVQCRQDGCEIYGTSLAPTALDALDRQLRKFHSNHANTMIMDLTKPGAELGNFYMLVTGMKKD